MPSGSGSHGCDLSMYTYHQHILSPIVQLGAVSCRVRPDAGGCPAAAPAAIPFTRRFTCGDGLLPAFVCRFEQLQHKVRAGEVDRVIVSVAEDVHTCLLNSTVCVVSRLRVSCETLELLGSATPAICADLLAVTLRTRLDRRSELVRLPSTPQIVCKLGECAARDLCLLMCLTRPCPNA
jgi:hypothetical protein